MQGNLKQIQLPEVLQFISMGKSTGLLSITDPEGVEVTLVIQSGRIINSSALDRRRRLGELLVHRGILKRSVLAQILALQRTIESDKRLGQILVERDIIKESTIKEVLRLQLEEEIWNLFGLEDGTFNFRNAGPDELGEPLVQIDIDPLLLEGTRRQDEWRRITKILPSDRIVVGLRDITQDFDFEEKRQLASQTEWKVLAQINGRFPLRAIINRSGMGRFEVYRIIADLMDRGIVYVVGNPSEPTEALNGASGDTAGRGDSAARGGARGLLSMLTGGRRSDTDEKLEFVTPVGGLCHFTNRLVEAALAARDWKRQPGDERLIERLWSEQLLGFTRADLITAEGNHLHSRRAETYMELFEFNDAVQDCYEDSVEALLQFMDELGRTLRNRMGDKQANRVIREMVDEILSRIRCRYEPSFPFGNKLQEVLRLPG